MANRAGGPANGKGDSGKIVIPRYADVLKSIADSRANEEKVPEGYLSVEQYAKQWGVHKTTTLRSLKELVKAGKADVVATKMRSGNKYVKTQVFKILALGV